MEKLPAWRDCDEKHQRGEPLTALEQFVYDNEPCGTVHEGEFRSGLRAVLDEQAGLALQAPPVRPNGCLAQEGDPPCRLPPGHQCSVCNAAGEK